MFDWSDPIGHFCCSLRKESFSLFDSHGRLSLLSQRVFFSFLFLHFSHLRTIHSCRHNHRKKCVCVCVCVYVRERERERKRESSNGPCCQCTRVIIIHSHRHCLQ